MEHTSRCATLGYPASLKACFRLVLVVSRHVVSRISKTVSLILHFRLSFNICQYIFLSIHDFIRENQQI